MNFPNPMQFLGNMLKMNPNVQNNPRNQEFLRTLQSGDDKKIEELANNLCQTYGTSPQQELQNFGSFQAQYRIK